MSVQKAVAYLKFLFHIPEVGIVLNNGVPKFDA